MTDSDEYEGNCGDPDPECSFCGGDGWDECNDPIQCMAPTHISNGYQQECQCKACGGSGLAKDQTVW